MGLRDRFMKKEKFTEEEIQREMRNIDSLNDDADDYDEDGYSQDTNNEGTDSAEDSVFGDDSLFQPPAYSRRTTRNYGNEQASHNESSHKNSGNIYNMNKSKQAVKKGYKVNIVILHEIFDAKNVVDLLKRDDTFVVVNCHLLTPEQRIRVLDFLDGAKLVTGSGFTKLPDPNSFLYVPAGSEIHSDSLDLIDFEVFVDY